MNRNAPIAPISKTQRKERMTALQKLGAELVELGEERLARIDLPEQLRDAVMEARRITRFEARRRQLQYIGKLMRRVDAEPVRAALDALHARSRREAATHKRIEAWRERLLADDTALTDLLREYPQADIKHLRALTRGALLEREANRPARSYRELYQALRALIAESVISDR